MDHPNPFDHMILLEIPTDDFLKILDERGQAGYNELLTGPGKLIPFFRNLTGIRIGPDNILVVGFNNQEDFDAIMATDWTSPVAVEDVMTNTHRYGDPRVPIKEN